ncbi:RNA polymerase factor sigma-54 [Neisseria chenwenguii]|uniref:RNA polymerase sigma-54 factor n=1 Tax=Neisseria chenwenguii TaxID=1853278 RepID=A0A220S225_9NEIS|nr:RNA polymerase factor sigma-54 [Neisseria chenwenguii]ASK27463.1 RNA polymerase sigma-54 factor [Neisseria chenwenguii]ROV56905.1 RNA polymerase sigma-54 factor [Neisseria chenwenguii]
MTNPNYGLKLKQTQQLNQKLQQSLRVLQMSGLEIEREVEDWLQENPLLERPEAEEFADFESESHVSAALPRNNQIGGDDAEDAWLNIAEEQDFSAYLHAQVCEHPLSEKEAAHVHILIDFLDEQGYFTETFEDVIDNTPLEWMLDEDDLQNALDLLQTFDPPGVAAANLTESLILQLMRLPASPARQLAAHLVQSSLDELGKNRGQNIRRFQKLYPNADEETVQTALDLIASLNPYPAYGFASTEPTAYIQPDVWVKETKDGWKVSSNDAAWPKIRLNREYCEMFREDGDASPEWKEKLSEARQKIDSLELRKNTVLRLAEYIVEKQEDFFVFGEIGLAPMLLKEAAAALGVAESTVSRAANQKYLACPRGLFALRYFFTQAVSTDSDNEGISQGAVKAVIAQIIENEDPAAPYSDEALVARLKQQGVELARRTVAKYRESLDIPPAHKRKIRARD